MASSSTIATHPKDNSAASPRPTKGQSGRQRVTKANLAIHDAHMAASLQGPTAMQRWFFGEDDIFVRGRRAGEEETRAANDALAAKIEQLLEDIRKTKNGVKW